MHNQDATSPDTGGERVVAGRYRLLSVLGEGGMGTVWRARDEVLRRDVAVKEVRASIDLPARSRARLHNRLEREAWAAARVNAPGVVTVYDVATFEDRPWIVMELVRGQSLADVITARGSLPPEEAAHVGAAVLAALVAAHSAGVLHRDVKPANVLLADDGRVVLTDFGIATVEGDTALTMTGEVVGSPEYLAPERALGRTPGPASDLWSLGALLYTAVQGRSPFRRTSALSTLRAIVDDELPPPHRAGPLAPVVEGLMLKDPEKRMTAEQAARGLGRVAGESAASATAPRDTVADPRTGTGNTTTEVTMEAATTAEATEEEGLPTADSLPTATAAAPAALPAAAEGDTTVDSPQAGDAVPAAGVPTTEAPTAEAPTAVARTAAAPSADAPTTAPAAAGASPRPEPAPSAAPTQPTPSAASGSAPVASSPSAGATPPAGSSAFGPPPDMAAFGPLAPAPAPDPGAGSGGPSAPQPARRRRRTGYVIGAVAAALVLIGGGLAYAFLSDGDDESGKGGAAKGGGAKTATDKASQAASQPVSVTVTGGATTYDGVCPPGEGQAPWFTAKFTAAGQPVQFSYRWVSEDGVVTDEEWRTMTFREGDPATQEATVRLSTWAREGTVRSAMAVEIKSPFDAKSNSVQFSLTCRPHQ